MAKSYTKNNLTYRFAGGNKWEFKAQEFTLLTPCASHDTAEKIASHVAGGLKRTNGAGIDGLARANISRLTISRN